MLAAEKLHKNVRKHRILNAHRAKGEDSFVEPLLDDDFTHDDGNYLDAYLDRLDTTSPAPRTTAPATADVQGQPADLGGKMQNLVSKVAEMAEKLAKLKKTSVAPALAEAVESDGETVSTEAALSKN